VGAQLLRKLFWIHRAFPGNGQKAREVVGLACAGSVRNVHRALCICDMDAVSPVAVVRAGRDQVRHHVGDGDRIELVDREPGTSDAIAEGHLVDARTGGTGIVSRARRRAICVKHWELERSRAPAASLLLIELIVLGLPLVDDGLTARIQVVLHAAVPHRIEW
jgi:hypothetical protein